MAIDEAKLDQFIGQFVIDFGAAMHAATVVIGDKLGLYKALADAGPSTAEQLARRTSYDGRLVEEWLRAQFVSGYCEYDPSTGAFSLTDEQAAVLADDSTPAFLADGGTWLLVEPMAIAGLENNVNPVSRIFYAGSVGICTPAAEAQPGGYALGNQVSDEQWQTLLGDAGFGHVRRATETPFNRVFEVRK